MSLFVPTSEILDRHVHPDKSKGEKRIPVWVVHILTVIAKYLVAPILFRLTAPNKRQSQAFEGKCGLILVQNHVSYLDPAFTYIALRSKQLIRPVGRDDLFEKLNGRMGAFVARLGMLPVKRDSADTSAIKRIVSHLKAGDTILIFPEGTRRGKGKKAPSVHAGCALMARMANVPLLACTAVGSGTIKEKGKFPRFHKVTVKFGNPVVLSDFDWLPKEDRLAAASWYVMRESMALYYQKPVEEIDMTAMFPGERDFAAEFASHEMPVHTPEEAIALCTNKTACQETR